MTVPVQITNTGVAPQDYFVDPRLNTTQNITLAQLGEGTVPLPMSFTNITAEPEWLVPTETSAIRAAQTSSIPAMFDLADDAGDPGDPALASASFGPGPLCQTSSSLFFDPPDGTVSAGLYLGEPTECGPYTGAAPTGTATDTMTAQTEPFDQAVSSPTGDLWQLAVNPAASFSPVVINPGQTSTIDVTITPSGAAGSIVMGTLYVDDYDGAVPPYDVFSGDELAALPYAYTIG